MNKIFDWVFIVLTFALTMSALGVVGSFEQGNIDFTGFFIGQAVCIAGITFTCSSPSLLSKKKSPRGAATPTKGNSNKTIFIIAREGDVCVNGSGYFQHR